MASNIKLLRALRTINASLQPRDLLFDQQLAVLNDSSRFKCIQVGRRGGKSWVMLSYALQIIFERPNACVVFAAPTADQAWSIAAPVLRKLLRLLQWGNYKVSDNTKSLIGPNGPCLVARGIRAGAEGVEGAEYPLVVIDEAGLFRSSDLRQAILSSIRPTLIDSGGTLLIGGRPGSGGYFKECMEGKHGYSCHKWEATDNVHISVNLKREMDELRAADPDVDSKAWFRRNYGNEFAADDDQNRIFYAFNDDCKVDAASTFTKHIGGLAFGPDLSIGLVVCGQQVDGTHIAIECQSLSPATPLPTIARLANDFVGRYPGLIYYGPHDRKATLHALTAAKCPVYASHSARSIDSTQHLNTLLTNGKLKILFPDLEQLTEQLATLKWAEGHSGVKLDSQQPRHLVQALLFASQSFNIMPTKVVEPKTINELMRDALYAKAARQVIDNQLMSCQTLRQPSWLEQFKGMKI